jgi:TatD DNase family protein
MNYPEPDKYIDIHNHGALPLKGTFQVENLMTHEERTPDNESGITYTIGIHPWFLSEDNYREQIDRVRKYAYHSNTCAIGETGFDKMKGASLSLQEKAFEIQVSIADEVAKPLFIHCVRSWDELLAQHKKLRPRTPWIVHGFRGKKELAAQLISKGMFLSFWFDFVIRPESSGLLKGLPLERIFLETDGSGTSIETIYKKVSIDLGLTVDELKAAIYSNFNTLFSINKKG